MDILATGIPNIDAEHKWIAEAVRGLRQVIGTSGDNSTARRIIGIIIDAFIVHSKNEERIAVEEGVDDCVMVLLKKSHVFMASQLNELKIRLESAEMPRDLLEELIDEIDAKMTTHFSEVDAPLLSRQSRGRPEKESN